MGDLYNYSNCVQYEELYTSGVSMMTYTDRPRDMEALAVSCNLPAVPYAVCKDRSNRMWVCYNEQYTHPQVAYELVLNQTQH